MTDGNGARRDGLRFELAPTTGYGPAEKRAVAPNGEAVEPPAVLLGRWEDAISGMRVDSVITDPPYGKRTHVGSLGESDGREGVAFSHWESADVGSFVSSWAPRTDRWIVAMTSHDLIPAWESSFSAAGWYVFAPVAAVVTGMGFRRAGDGPASWTIHIVVARPRSRRCARWRSLPGGYCGTSSPSMAGGRGKPSWLVDALVSDYSDPGMLVCDPCAGWGSTLVAARKLGRRAIGAEVDPDAWTIADRRVRGEQARPLAEQPSLFDSTNAPKKGNP